ncbi:MAG TPA: ribosome small subunit-dependent GTPase A [Candidatus Doudnabacteria bacterium]|nr:ribosome small subunit-dependent GTPase A [Candidatus Doudnabacteria bacterium]
MKLSDLGYKKYLSKVKLNTKELTARITSENKTDWTMVNEDGELRGIVMNTYRKNSSTEDLPKVGDFVVYEKIPNENKAKIIKVLPRFSLLSRRLPEQNNQMQVLATNIDTMFVISGLDQDFNINQLRRYLTMAQSDKIKSVLVINKTDLGPGADARESLIIKQFPQLKILHTSATIKTGIDELYNLLKSQETVIFLGSSGAGKSSLINALLSSEQQTTKSVREDGKGRHTTTKREMFLLPNGTVVVDSPGIRTLEVDTSKQSLELDDELSELSLHCRFRDCDHIKSKGCAIIDAVENKKIDREQYNNFLKLIRDWERSEEKSDFLKKERSKKKIKTQHKALRQAYKTRKPPKK